MQFQKLQHLRPSNAARWFDCTASAVLYAMCANEIAAQGSNAAANHGTVIHNYAAFQMSRTFEIVSNINYADEMTAVNGLSQEDKQIAEDYIAYVDDQLPIDAEVDIEQKLELETNGLEGTPDCMAYSAVESKLQIFDLKTGNIEVLAKDNRQLLIYALMAYHTLTKQDKNIDTIELHIVQPPMNHYDVSFYTEEQLLGEFEPLLQKTLKKINTNPSFNSTESACKYCYFKLKCTTYRNDRAKKLKQVTSRLTKTLETLDNETISKLLKNKVQVEDFLETLFSEALKRLESGDQIEGFKLVRRTTHRRWIHENEAYAKLSGVLSDDEIIKKNLITPSKAVTLCKNKDIDLDDLITKPEGGLTLASIDDKRKAVEIESSSNQFNELPNSEI